MSVEHRGGEGSLAGLRDRLDQVVARHVTVGERLAAGAGLDSEERKKLSKEYSDLTGIVAAIQEWNKARAELAALEAMINNPGEDAEVKAMAEDYIRMFGSEGRAW